MGAANSNETVQQAITNVVNAITVSAAENCTMNVTWSQDICIVAETMTLVGVTFSQGAGISADFKCLQSQSMNATISTQVKNALTNLSLQAREQSFLPFPSFVPSNKNTTLQQAINNISNEVSVAFQAHCASSASTHQGIKVKAGTLTMVGVSFSQEGFAQQITDCMQKQKASIEIDNQIANQLTNATAQFDLGFIGIILLVIGIIMLFFGLVKGAVKLGAGVVRGTVHAVSGTAHAAQTIITNGSTSQVVVPPLSTVTTTTVVPEAAPAATHGLLAAFGVVLAVFAFLAIGISVHDAYVVHRLIVNPDTSPPNTLTGGDYGAAPPRWEVCDPACATQYLDPAFLKTDPTNLETKCGQPCICPANVSPDLKCVPCNAQLAQAPFGENPCTTPQIMDVYFEEQGRALAALTLASVSADSSCLSGRSAASYQNSNYFTLNAYAPWTF